MDVKVADRAIGNQMPVLVAQLDLVSGDRLARRAVANVARLVRQEDVEHLGRADAVNDLAAEMRFDMFADRRRQRLARRKAEPQVDGFPRRQVGCCKHARIARR